jgi:hypothetical protein
VEGLELSRRIRQVRSGLVGVFDTAFTASNLVEEAKALPLPMMTFSPGFLVRTSMALLHETGKGSYRPADGSASSGEVRAQARRSPAGGGIPPTTG